MEQYGALRLALSQTWLYQAREIYSQRRCWIESLTCVSSLQSVCKHWPIHMLQLIQRHLHTETPTPEFANRSQCLCLLPKRSPRG